MQWPKTLYLNIVNDVCVLLCSVRTCSISVYHLMYCDSVWEVALQGISVENRIKGLDMIHKVPWFCPYLLRSLEVWVGSLHEWLPNFKIFSTPAFKAYSAVLNNLVSLSPLHSVSLEKYNWLTGSAIAHRWSVNLCLGLLFQAIVGSYLVEFPFTYKKSSLHITEGA